MRNFYYGYAYRLPIINNKMMLIVVPIDMYG